MFEKNLIYTVDLLKILLHSKLSKKKSFLVDLNNIFLEVVALRLFWDSQTAIKSELQVRVLKESIRITLEMWFWIGFLHQILIKLFTEKIHMFGKCNGADCMVTCFYAWFCV